MALTFKNTSLLLLLASLCSCVSNGVAPGSGNQAYDGVTCNYTVTADMTAATFETHLQNGTSTSAPYVVCIADGVDINGGQTGVVNISKEYLLIQGFSNSTSTITNISASSVSFNDPSIIFRRLKLIGNSADALYSSSGPGTSTTLTVANANIVSSNRGVYLNGNNGRDIVFSGSILNIVAGLDGISLSSNNGGSTTAAIATSDITAGNGRGILVYSQNGGSVMMSVGDLILRENNSTAGGNAALEVILTGGGSLLLNSSSTSKSLACNVSGSVRAFSSVLSTSASSVTGSFSIANMQNANNSSIGTCL
jgi:hypothetical protein